MVHQYSGHPLQELKVKKKGVKEMSTNSVTTNSNVKTGVNARYLTMTAMLSAIAFILMFLDFAVPFMPNFIKLDISELPALIGAFSMGPVSGIVICLIKNLIHLTITTTSGVGELSNFILGVAFVLPAGLIYKFKKNRKGALIGSLAGALFMAVFSVVSNYFLVYPFYTAFMPEDAIIGAYNAIASAVGGHMDNLLECLVVFNMPFTFLKGMISVGITFLIYKHISPIIKGTNSRKN
jgi:riboflavin transporter FmnP